jgi:hypothetical protein
VASVKITVAWGALVRLSASFAEADGTPIDPGSVVAMTKDPNGDFLEYEQTGSDPTIERDDVGEYHLDFVAEVPGLWYFRFESYGAGQAVGEGRFTVATSEFEGMSP